MFWRQRKAEEVPPGNEQQEVHARPRVFLIDMPSECAEELKSQGFNVKKGTFGQPYECERQGNIICTMNGRLGGLGESDIVLVDLGGRYVEEAGEAPPLPDREPAEHSCIYAPDGQNYFNPRYLMAKHKTAEFVRVVNNGGVVVVFAGAFDSEKYYMGNVRDGGIRDTDAASINNYDWLPTLYGTHKTVFGEEVFPAEGALGTKFGDFLSDFLSDAYYRRAFPRDQVGRPLATNRDGDCVGFADLWGDGFLVVLPQFERLTPVCSYLLTATLPELVPKLFPDFEAESWRNDPKYQMPEIKDLYEDRQRLEEQHTKRLKELDEQIEQRRESVAHLDKICTASGDELVENLAEVLRGIGYEDVEVCDEKGEDKEEDIQLKEERELTLVETKGLLGGPKDSDCQQILRYVKRRQSVMRRIDIGGIFIVNHQRNLEPSTREPVPFRKQQIKDARRDGTGLATTWDVRRAMLMLRERKLTAGDLQWSLRQVGLIQFLPAGSVLAGKVTHYYDRKGVAETTVRVDVRRGDEVAFYRDQFLFRQSVESLQVDNADVEEVRANTTFGLKVEEEVRAGDEVYLIRQEAIE